MSAATPETPRLTGLLRLVSSQCPDHVRLIQFDPVVLTESHALLQNRRRKRQSNLLRLSEESSFESLCRRHRYVCFFAVQGNSSNFYSNHCLLLRKRLAESYHDVMTTFVITLGNEPTSMDENLFCQGTGFASLPPSPMLLSILNINQVPSLVILDTSSGQKLSQDAMIAVEWNDAHSVINAWQKGESGLTLCQKVLAIACLQSDCVIL